jgi:RimJ/RimL family protein N-acetyltransferase
MRIGPAFDVQSCPAHPLCVMRLIATARLRLEPLTAEHADEMFGVLSDPAIYTFENSPPASLAGLRERYARLESRRSADGSEQWLNWVVRLADVAEPLGYVQATVLDDHTALIAYEFASAHWGRGYAQEAVVAMLGELAAAYGVNMAGAVFKQANFRSRRLLQRLGMEPAAEQAFPRAHAASDEDAMRLPLVAARSPER